MPTGPKSPPMLHRPALRARGWTHGMVRRFLGEPDANRPNPMDRDGPPVRLWRLETVEAIERTPEFREALARAGRRKTAARKAVETKLAAMDAWIDAIEIGLPADFVVDEVIEHAVRDYNDRAIDRYCDGRSDYVREATLESDPRFLSRIAVNWLRHRGTEYERHLAETYGRVGVERAYARIKAKVLDAIASRWPELAAECARQRAQLGPI